MHYFDRDISWLQFNGIVLAEAGKTDVPLYERIQFLSIFSSNLDEFFRVRYPALRLAAAGQQGDTILNEVKRMIREQQEHFGALLRHTLLPALKERGIHLYYNEPFTEAAQAFATEFFYTRALSFLQPVWLRNPESAPELQNNALYLLVSLERGTEQATAIVNIPDAALSRFISIPATTGAYRILFLDDIIRYNLDKVFPGYQVTGSYSIKMTRNADIDIADEHSDLFEEHLQEMVREREKGRPTRLLYETGMPEALQVLLSTYCDTDRQSFVAGGRYHNLKDLARLPDPGLPGLRYAAQPARSRSSLAAYTSVFQAISAADVLLHFPYQAYSTVLRFFNEAAIDPLVTEISVTLYRVAQDSLITNALISAARNGKTVTAFVELKARFDETNNLNWARKMKAAGVRIIYSIPGMKVHAKLALIKRKEGWRSQYYGLVSTGNFNEQTARFYTDHVLLTVREEITQETELLFAFLAARQKPSAFPFLHFRHLLVAGFNLFSRLEELVDREIANLQMGKGAGITIKLNNLQDKQAIGLLYKAGAAGVPVELLVRGICCLVPGIPGRSMSIRVRKLVGRYLEHSRIYVFHNDGDPELYIGSSDLMSRNLNRRIEVIAAVRDETCRKELLDFLALQLADNTQTSLLAADGSWQQRLPAGQAAVDAQTAMYDYTATL